MNHDVTKAPVKEQARKELLDRWQVQPETEYVQTGQCLGRVTAEPVYAVNTIPKCRISAMDGYAVKSAAFSEGVPDISKWVLNKDFSPADTGDDFPDEFDTVIPVEKLHYDAEGTLVLEPDYTFQPGANIRPAGCIMRPGDLLSAGNIRVTPELQANFAAGGVRTVPVIRRPVAAFLPTGSELTPVGMEPRRGENVECNSLLISGYLRRWGAEVVCFPIVRDEPRALEAALDEALRFADIVILNGGSSKGTEDYTSRMLEGRAEFFLHTVRTVPGRPVGISLIGGKPVINMPGPTLAAWVVNDWLLYPMICRYYGIPEVKRQTVQAFLTEDFKKGPPVEVYTRVRLENRKGLYYATPIGRGARTSELLRDGIGLLIAPVGGLGYEKGQPVQVELLAPEELIPVTEEAPHMELPEHCNQCGNRCPADALQCGRGKAYFGRLRSGEEFQSDSELANALVACAQGVRHMATMLQKHGKDVEELFSALSEEEQTQLLALLNKQQAKLNADHAKRHAQGGQKPGRKSIQDTGRHTRL